MDKKEVLKYVGSMQQIAYVRPVVYQEGRARHMNALEVRSGPLQFTVMADKCMDVSELSYKGINMSFLAKPGLEGRNHYDTNGDEALRSIMGGLFFTCGLENICAPFHSKGRDYPMHGRIRTTPAEHICSDASWQDDDYVISVSGEMREAELFGENMVLRRNIETHLGKKMIVVKDRIENHSYRPEPMMLLYHCNLGYPFLDETCELFLPSKEVIGREAFSTSHEDTWNHMEGPKDNEGEYVFIHQMAADEAGNTIALVVNPVMQLGLSICFNKNNLPYFMEWKAVASGDYVLGLEPSNSSVYARAYHEKQRDLHMLKPFASEESQLVFTILDGPDELEPVKEQIKRLKGE